MRLIILGAGGYGRTVADVAAQSGAYDEIVFLDDNSTAPDVIDICANISAHLEINTHVYPAFGNNEGRISWLNRLAELGAQIPSLVHARAYVSPTAVLEEGVVVMPGAIVNTGVTVKRGCIINCGAIVDHGCVLEEGVHVCLGAIVKAENRIPAFSKIDSGTVIENRQYPL